MGFFDLLSKTQNIARDYNVERFNREQESRRSRVTDPMLDYWNKDVRWMLCDANIGPGGEYFSGVEVHAMWNRPEEPLFYGALTVAVTGRRPVNYDRFEYRLVAIGLLRESANQIVLSRNKQVLGDEQNGRDLE